ncbi:sulfotransferase [Vibrio gigantis]|uniref:sulfotransferase family protein n=1 Tax=Vibrio gigantis TaxID=296199 RepID=UPI003D100D91
MMKDNVVIIGAPRSGTNMLRDMLIKLDGVETWPCDEINYIWRHGNVKYSSDVFSPAMATPAIKKFIRSEFDDFRKKSNATVIVEKTCANALRVSFVEAVIPGSKYIHIIRDGADAVGSAKLRWTAKLDIPYLLKKIKYVPKIDLPFYALKYFGNRIAKLLSKEGKLSYWGPLLDERMLSNPKLNIFEVCAIQWKECVVKAREQLSLIENERVYTLRYEDFVANPKEEFLKIAEFIGKKPSQSAVESVVGNTSSKSVGKGRSEIESRQKDIINNIIGDELSRYGYKHLE